MPMTAVLHPFFPGGKIFGSVFSLLPLFALFPLVMGWGLSPGRPEIDLTCLYFFIDPCFGHRSFC